MDILEFKNTVFDLLRSIGSNVNSIFAKDYGEFGLTYVQVHILVQLYICNEYKIGDLGRTLNISSGNISSMCKKFEKDGLINRIRDKEDERVVKVRLTKKGTEIVSTIENNIKSKYSSVLEKEPLENLQQIIDGFQKFNDILEKMK